jgi:hypothetical protein
MFSFVDHAIVVYTFMFSFVDHAIVVYTFMFSFVDHAIVVYTFMLSFIDHAIVVYTFMFSFFFVIVCGIFEWNRIFAGFFIVCLYMYCRWRSSYQ